MISGGLKAGIEGQPVSGIANRAALFCDANVRIGGFATATEVLIRLFDYAAGDTLRAARRPAFGGMDDQRRPAIAED